MKLSLFYPFESEYEHDYIKQTKTWHISPTSSISTELSYKNFSKKNIKIELDIVDCLPSRVLEGSIPRMLQLLVGLGNASNSY